MEFFRIKDSIEWIQIIWSVIFVLSSIGNFVYQVVLHADTQDFRISFRTRSWLIERLSSSDCTELRSHPIKRSYVSSSELPLVKILGLSGASYACHIKHGSWEQAEWYDTQQANYVPWDLSARTPAQNSSALSAVTIIRGSPDSGWATRPLFLQDSTERHCDHAPHPKTPQTMQQFRIPFIVLLLVLFLLPVSPDQAGAVSGGPLWCYVVYMFFHANLFHLLGNCLSVYLVWYFRSDPPLCGSSFALRGGVAGCADHLHWYSDRRGFGCRLCLGGLSSESLPPEIITAKREMYRRGRWLLLNL